LLEYEPVREDPRCRELVASIQRGGKRLQEVVTGLIDMAEIQNGLLQLVPVRMAPAQLLHLVIDSFRPALEQRHLAVDLAGLDALPTIEADFDGMVKVFYQLLINAIKYTPDGGKITVCGRSLAAGEAGLDDDGVEIVISDTGIGIDTQDQEAIFTKFYQTGEISLHSTGNTKFKGGGPGLGLAVARGLIEAHGGHVWVESAGRDEGCCPGAQFHVALLRRPRLAQTSFENLAPLDVRAPFATTSLAGPAVIAPPAP
jgi:signal transduction histidine kinase